MVPIKTTVQINDILPFVVPQSKSTPCHPLLAWPFQGPVTCRDLQKGGHNIRQVSQQVYFSSFRVTQPTESLLSNGRHAICSWKERFQGLRGRSSDELVSSCSAESHI